jgi:hypothetical protein
MPQCAGTGAPAPEIEEGQPPGGHHPRERDQFLRVDREGSVDFSGAWEDTPPQSGCPSTLPMPRAARAAADGDRTGGELSDLSTCGGSPFPIPEGCLGCYSHRDLRTPCSGWPS